MRAGANAGASGVDKGGHLNFTLLGQYAANFGADANGHGGTVITDMSVKPTSNSLRRRRGAELVRGRDRWSDLFFSCSA
jgi:hypothetical protein